MITKIAKELVRTTEETKQKSPVLTGAKVMGVVPLAGLGPNTLASEVADRISNFEGTSRTRNEMLQMLRDANVDLRDVDLVRSRKWNRGGGGGKASPHAFQNAWADSENPFVREFGRRIREGNAGKRFKDTIYYTGNLPIDLHEAGHIINAHKTQGMDRFFTSPGRMLMDKALLPAALYSMFRGLTTNSENEANRGKVTKTLDAINDYANPIMAAPVLVEEAFASGRALNYLRKTRGLQAALKATPGLGAALATYATVAAAPMLMRRAAVATKLRGEQPKPAEAPK
jgi:hypothetical protein